MKNANSSCTKPHPSRVAFSSPRWNYPISLIVVFFLASLMSYGDAPLSPPSGYEISSPSSKFFAKVDPKSGVCVYAAGSTNALWTLSKWFRISYLADDGDHFISVYEGGNLIPKDFSKDLPLITFWNRNKKIRDVTVGELFPDTSVLKSTESHYYWGDITRITNTSLVVTRCDGLIVRMNVTTGEMLK
jgi:hypothetical protein